jgi:hypothetical protein
MKDMKNFKGNEGQTQSFKRKVETLNRKRLYTGFAVPFSFQLDASLTIRADLCSSVANEGFI